MLEEAVGALDALPLDQRLQRIQPFAGFLGIDVAPLTAGLHVLICHTSILNHR
nr:hypothetical protein [Methylogaea oryzae]